MVYYLVFFGLFAARKIADQVRSRRNRRRLLATRTLLPTRDRAYPFLLATHIAFFIFTPLEILLLDRPFIPLLGIPMIGLFIAAALLRLWATALLNEHWSSQVAVPKDLEPVTSGPFSWIRHPNYLGMTLELIAVGLMYTAWISTLIVAVLNGIAVVKRIQAEEEVLFEIPAYRTSMLHKARLIPGIY